MATICLLSAKGSPGVTTTVVGLALAWSDAASSRSALAIDADPLGGDVAAGVLRGALSPASGMLHLATSRGVEPIDAIDAAVVNLRRDGSARLLAGVPDSARAAALTLAWDVLERASDELSRTSTDLLVDCGRIDRLSAPAPWLLDADLTALVVRPTLVGVAAAHRFLEAGESARATDGPSAHPPVVPRPDGLIVVDAPSPYRPAEVAEVLRLPLLASIPFDPSSARVHSEGAAAGRGFARSGYSRALHGLAGTIAERCPTVLPQGAPA